ncbi:MAG: FliA/WhiG family RNA polymerase sigma factor [Rhodobacteraceae bacterium]|nr:MAG: FliA/WhiG family RNA polymerase sigma factor [Paracoccaceae bacterium]
MEKGYPEQIPDVEGLISGHMDLVRKIAWHMHGRVGSAIEIDDLIQIGYFGLVTAAQKYSVKEGASFASYAVLRIRGAIVDHLRKSSNLCRTTIQMQQKTKMVEASLLKKLHRSPSRQEISDELGIKIDEFDEWERAFAANVHTSLDAAYDEFSMWFMSKDSSPEQKLNEADLRKSLRMSLEDLSQKEALVIQLYYVEELNVYEIAEVLDVTTGRVSQIKKSAISKLRKSMDQREKSFVQ